MGGEVAGGYISNSLALISDAIHMLTDFSGFLVSFLSIFISKKKPSKRLSYGYHRAEIVGALVSVLMIWVFTVWIVWEATERIINQNFEVDGLVMGITAFVGLLANIIMGKILHQHVFIINIIQIIQIIYIFIREVMGILTEVMLILMVATATLIAK